MRRVGKWRPVASPSRSLESKLKRLGQQHTSSSFHLQLPLQLSVQPETTKYFVAIDWGCCWKGLNLQWAKEEKKKEKEKEENEKQEKEGLL